MEEGEGGVEGEPDPSVDPDPAVPAELEDCPLEPVSAGEDPSAAAAPAAAGFWSVFSF